MSLVQAWQHALQTIADANKQGQQGLDAQLASAEAYSNLTEFLEPSIPSKSRYFDHQHTHSYTTDPKADHAIQTLLGSSASWPSTSKRDLSAPNPILVALSNHYIDRCLQAFEATASKHGIASVDESERICLNPLGDLEKVLASVTYWFRAWLSPYTRNAIFERLPDHRQSLEQALQGRFRSIFDGRAVQMLRGSLEHLIMAQDDIDLESTFVVHLNAAGLASTTMALLTRVVNSEISRKVRAMVDGIDVEAHDQVLPLESAARPILQQWLDDEMKPRFAAIQSLCLQLSSTDEAMADDEATEQSTWQQQLDYQLDKALCLTRAGQLFDLVAMYPDSSAAIDDLRLSLQTADQRLSVANTLSSSLQMRLLHPGAHTRDIIQMYVHLVRALREMDPPGVVLSRVVSPLRRYLRARKDTVLVIVASMLGDDPDFTLLKDELERADQEEQEQEEHAGSRRKRRPRRSLQTAGAPTGKSKVKRTTKRRLPHTRRGGADAYASDSDASSEEDWDDPNWVPKPVEAGSGYRMSTSKDIISMLTSIFDDRSGFIAALEKSMADQLVQVKGYRAMKEYRNNMILKKRFGEKNMGKCDVMLGDVTESRRIDSEVHQRRRNAVQSAGAVEGMVSRLHPLIVSRQFWPEHTTKPGAAPTFGASAATSGAAAAAPVGVGEFTLPLLFHHAQEEYGKTYSQAKAMRRLHWLNHLGSVELDVELDGGDSISVECSLIQASTLEVISRCKGRSSEAIGEAASAHGANLVTLTEVMEELNLQREKDARDALEFWVQVGLLRPMDALADAFVVQSHLLKPALAADEEVEADQEPF